MTNEEYTKLSNIIGNLKKYIDDGNKPSQNTALLTLMEHCCAYLNRDADISARDLLSVCERGGFRGVLTKAAERVPGELAERLAQSGDALDRLKDALEQAKRDGEELEKRKRETDDTQRKLTQLRASIEEYRRLEKENEHSLELLRGFGVRLDEDFHPSKARDEIDGRCADLRRRTGVLTSFLSELQEAEERYSQSKEQCAERLLDVYRRNAEGVAELALSAREEAERLNARLAEKRKELAACREKLAAETVDIDGTIDELDRYLKAIEVHKAENKSLYRLYEEIGVPDAASLRARIEQVETSLDKTLEPYDALLSVLREKRQRGIDKTVEDIEKMFGISLGPETGD